MSYESSYPAAPRIHHQLPRQRGPGQGQRGLEQADPDRRQAKASEGWNKLTQIVEDYKKAHNGASVYAPTFIEDCEPAVKKLQEEYGFEYTIEYVK